MKSHWILLLLLLVPLLGTASANTDDPLIVTHVMVRNGTTTGTLGMVSVLRIDGTSVPPAFHLSADAANVLVDHADLAIQAIDSTNLPDTTQTHYEQYELHGLRNGAAAALFVHPTPGSDATVRFSTSCFDVQPSDLASEYRPRRVDHSTPGHKTELASAAKVTPCGQLNLVTIEGDFLLGLWDWDAQWQSTSGQGKLSTGYTTQDSAIGEADEAFIHVQDGRLVLPIADNNIRLFLSNATVTAPEILLGDIEGQVRPTQEMTFDGNDLILRGNIKIALEPEGVNQPMQATVLRTTPLAPAAASATAIPGSPMLLLATGALLIATIVTLHRIHRRPERSLAILWSEHELDLRLAPRTRRERRALGMQLLGAHHALEGHKLRSQRLQGKATELYNDPMEALMGLGEALLAVGAYDHALDAFFVIQESKSSATQQVRAQVGAAVAHLRRGGDLDQHVCAEYLRDAQSRDPGTVRRLLARAGDLGTELGRIDAQGPDASTAMFG